MATLVINARKQIDVAIFDVPCDFIQTALPAYKFLLMQIGDEYLNVMCEVNPEYIPYVIYDNRKKLL